MDERINTNDVVIKIVGNKWDLFQLEEEASKQQKNKEIQEALSKISQQHYDIINTSAKTGHNVNFLFETIAKNCFEKFEKVG